MSQHQPITLATNDDGTPRLLERHLAIASSSPDERKQLVEDILHAAMVSDAVIYRVRPKKEAALVTDGAERPAAASPKNPKWARAHDAEGLSRMLSELHEMVITRITQARRLGNDAFAELDLPPAYLLIEDISDLLRIPDEGETEWFQQGELRTWTLDRLVKLMSANKLAGITVVVTDNFSGFDRLSESSLGYSLLMKADSLVLGSSTPESRASLLRVQPDEDQLGDLAEGSATYADATWFHPVTLLAETPAAPDTSAEQALYDALAPVLGITADDDDRLVSLAKTVAEMIASSELEVPERIRDTYRRELLSAA